MSEYEENLWGSFQNSRIYSDYDLTQNNESLSFYDSDPTFSTQNYSNYGFQSELISSNFSNPYQNVIPPGYEYTDENGDPPLLDELEIYPERILEKSLTILNPYHINLQQANNCEYLFLETDLAGPLCFCIVMGIALFLSENKINFGYIYGLSFISVILMYFLLTLMDNTAKNYVTIPGVASVLGYSIIPIVGLSIIGIFFTLNSFFGWIITGLSIFASTATASRILCLMTGDPEQRFLIAYPCSLAYIMFAMLVMF